MSYFFASGFHDHMPFSSSHSEIVRVFPVSHRRTIETYLNCTSPMRILSCQLLGKYPTISFFMEGTFSFPMSGRSSIETRPVMLGSPDQAVPTSKNVSQRTAQSKHDEGQYRPAYSVLNASPQRLNECIALSRVLSSGAEFKVKVRYRFK